MTLLFYIALLISAAHSYTPPARWGQATSLVYSSLFIQGGKQDPSNEFGYTGAPAKGDLLYLPLSSPFSVNDPPWTFANDPNNATSSPGPSVAWHTLSASNTSLLLLFGGLPSPSVPLATQPDSAWLVNVYNRLTPSFEQEKSGWADEPIRRMHHAAVSSTTGEVYIFGGERADGSLWFLSDHYVFNPSTSTFTLLPTENAPPALTGHAAVILPNGKILVFGGFSANGLLPFTTIYVLDTTTKTWSTQQATSTNAPPGRRGFAYVLLDENTILIHGGCDGSFRNTMFDGWTYKIDSGTWTRVSALDGLGTRKDHFAVAYGGQVIFGFGYQDNGPADASIIVFDPASNSFPSTFTPPPPTASVTVTIPLPTSTNKDDPPTGTQTGPAVHPTTTHGVGGGNNDGNDGGGKDGDGGSTAKPAGATSRTTVIAIATVLSVFALVAAGVGAMWYLRRQQRHRWAEGGVGGVFSPLNGEDGPQGVFGAPSPARMANGAPQEKGLLGGAVGSVGGALSSGGAWVAGALGLGAAAGVGAGVAARERDKKQRRDMLADEDEREFGYGWYDEEDGRSSRLGRLRQGSGGSTWSLMSVFRPKLRREGSALSGRSLPSRGASLLHAEEKDPFSDDVYRDVPVPGAIAVVAGGSARPSSRRQMSFNSVTSVSSNYVDPFADPFAVSEQDITGPGALLADIHHGHARGPLSPVAEASRSSGSQSHSTSSHEHPSVLSPFSTVSRSSFGISSNSHGSPAFPLGASPAATPGSPIRPRTMSIVDARPTQPDQPMRRSDTWWARFAGKSLLDRRSSHRSGPGPQVEFRDPNPLPQRLGFVTEETASVMRGRSDGSDASGAPATTPYGRAGHGKSMSSLQTQRTADSAAIDRMGGNVDVMLRGTRQTGSTSTRGSVVTREESGDDGNGTARDSWAPSELSDGGEEIYTSPVEMVSAAAFGLAKSASPPPRPSFSPVSSSNSQSSERVADRVRAYERRVSMDVPSSPPPTNTKQREERAPRRKSQGNYGLVARPSLFVANPDAHKVEGSGDSYV
ncbi:hypothetical protein B0H15DRAFT_798005 [Mycena belliarum]|uniref:Galactose oxidase n=1 Tax=Mycena belliarum TaxID=1033014 RepID=A0AAD6XQN3_9AGAR|nr:hypothetical protein B0H15DRAFT_798005 [Mycena belliae]